MVGGLLVLTNQRLHHGPLNTRPAGELLAKMAAATGPAGSAKVVNLVVARANEARAVPLRDIASVEPLKKRSLRVVGRDGGYRDFGIAAAVLAPIWSSRPTSISTGPAGRSVGRSSSAPARASTGRTRRRISRRRGRQPQMRRSCCTPCWRTSGCWPARPMTCARPVQCFRRSVRLSVVLLIVLRWQMGCGTPDMA